MFLKGFNFVPQEISFFFSSFSLFFNRIAKLDSHICNCTVLAFNKWQEIFKECESALGMSGDATNDVFSAWNRLASDAYQKRNIWPVSIETYLSDHTGEMIQLAYRIAKSYGQSSCSAHSSGKSMCNDFI